MYKYKWNLEKYSMEKFINNKIYISIYIQTYIYSFLVAVKKVNIDILLKCNPFWLPN